MNNKRITLCLLVSLFAMTPVSVLKANPVKDNHPLQELWEESSKKNEKAQRALADYYLSQGAFKQSMDVLSETGSCDTFEPEIFEKIIRSIKGMRKERDEIRRLSQIQSPSLREKATLFQLYLLVNNKSAAAEIIHELSLLDPSNEYLKFLANGAETCLPPEESLPFIERLAESERKKERPSSYPFLKAANMHCKLQKHENAITILDEYLYSYDIPEDFSYPNWIQIFSDGYQQASIKRMNLRSTIEKEYSSEQEKSNKSLRTLLIEALGTKGTSFPRDISNELSRELEKSNSVTSLEHLSLALIFKKIGLTGLFEREIQKALNTKLSGSELDTLRKEKYSGLSPIEITQRHQSMTYTLLAKYQKNNGNPDKAVTTCKEALIEYPWNEEAIQLMDEFTREPLLRGLTADALRQINKIHNNIRLLSIAAANEQKQYNYPQMYDTAHKAFGYAPHDTRALDTYVKACLHKGLGERAVDACLTSIGHGADETAFEILSKIATDTGLISEARTAVKDIVQYNSHLKPSCLTGYLNLCTTVESREELILLCKDVADQSLNQETSIIAGTIGAKALIRNGKFKEARECIKPVIDMIFPSSHAFESVKELSFLLKMDNEFSVSLERKAEISMGPDTLECFVEAARLAYRANLDKDVLSYFGKALESTVANRQLEDEFLDIGSHINGFPFFMQGLLEKTTGHYEFYRLLGKYYLERGHARNGVAFLSKASKHFPYRKDIQLLYGRALCAEGKPKEGLIEAESALEDMDNISEDDLWGVIRESLKHSNSSIPAMIMKYWMMSPLERNHKNAESLSRFSSLRNDYIHIVKSVYECDSYTPWISLIDANAKLNDSRQENLEEALTSLESAMKKAHSIKASFEENSLPTRICKCYFSAIVKNGKYNRGITTFEELLTGNSTDLQIRKLYEKLCIMASREGDLLKSLGKSREYYPPLSYERMDRIEELATELFKSRLLDVFLSEMAALSTLSPEEAASSMYLQWYSSLLKNDCYQRIKEIEDNLLRRLNLLGKKAIPMMRRLGKNKEVLALIDRLLLRHGETGRLSLLKVRGDILSEEVERKEDALKTYMNIVKCAPDSVEADKASLSIMDLLSANAIDPSPYTAIVAKIAAKANKSPEQMIALCHFYLDTFQWTKVTKALEEICRTSHQKINDDTMESIVVLMEKIIFSPHIKKEHTVVKRAVALLARKHLNPVIDNPFSQRLREICAKSETDYLKRLLQFSKDGTSRKKGLILALKGCYGIEKEEPLVTEPQREESLRKLIRLRPAVKDIYGNNLAQTGRVALMKLLMDNNRYKEAISVGKNLQKDSNRLGPDEPGSAWLTSDWLLIEMKEKKSPQPIVLSRAIDI